jgi:hypothetical protein
LCIAACIAANATWAEPLIRSTQSAPSSAIDYKLPAAALVGNLSCASASCHSAGDHGRPGSEYSTWANSDPHFRSYRVLFDKRSRDMMAKLGATALPAHQNDACLKCHAPRAIATKPMHAGPLAGMGVGCEDCHGPAEKYLTEHFRSDFKALSRQGKAETYGLFPTKDLSFRVAMCASCHVGDVDREVNHDLIAAGHPRLAFEYTSYHHWKENSIGWRHWQETAADFDARAWQIGQVACAQAAARLLQKRAADKKAPWPELAEYSCHGCHRDLGPGRSWQPLTESAHLPGAIRWGTWYFSTVELAFDNPGPMRDEIVDLRSLLASPGDPKADEIARRAGVLSEQLNRRLAELEHSANMPFDGKYFPERFAAIIGHSLSADGRRLRDLDWDGATQHYLAAAALYYAWAGVDPASRHPRLRSPLTELNGLLSFPKGYNSPKDSDPERVLKLFQQLRSSTLDPRESR